jgi:hypothetical protein
MSEDVYCVDSSSLMDLPRQYPRGRFPTLWDKLEALIEAGRLIAPREVLKEIKQGDDTLVAWAKNNARMFKQLDSDQATVASEILEICPALIDPMSEAPQADPFLIALAKVGGGSQARKLFRRRYVVVTQENRNKPNKIPQLCLRFTVDCIRLLDLFEREGWQF